MEKNSADNSPSEKKDDLVRERYTSDDKDKDSSSSDTKKESTTSICDVMKEDTSEVIQKLESKIPTLAQNYSDLYNAYLHMLDDIHGTCCISEKEFVDRMNLTPEVIKGLEKYSDTMKNNLLNSIEMTTTLYDMYVKMRISMIKSFDSYAHTWMESYGKMLSEFSKNADKWNDNNRE